MKFRAFIIPLVIFLSGFVFDITGTLFKFMHWPYGYEIYLLGAGFKVFGIILGIIKLIQIYRKGN